jgi:hypothetical protein
MMNAIRRLGKNPVSVLLVAGLFLHFVISVFPLAAEVRLLAREAPLLRGRSNEERRKLLLDGKLDLVEDHEFIARCQRELPIDAEVLIITNLPANTFILNYYLYPRKTSDAPETLRDGHWAIRYFTPKAAGQNVIKGPVHGDSID